MSIHRWNRLACLLVALVFSTAPHAQTVISKRTEVQRTVTQSIPDSGGDGVRIATETFFSNNSPPPLGATVSTVEFEVITLAFQIPNFDPADLGKYRYGVSMFFKNGNGSGTAYPDETGYVEFEMHETAGQEPRQVYLYAVPREPGDVELFMNLDDLSVNQAVDIMNNSNFRLGGPGVDMQTRMREFSNARRRYFPPPAIGEERHTGLRGNYMTLPEIQQQVFDQTQCWIEQDDKGIYYLDYCS